MKDAAKGKREGAAATSLPSRPIERWLAPLHRFLHVQAAGGIALLLATIVALVLANSDFSHEFAELWEIPVEFGFGDFSLKGTLGHLIINDGLMTLFFFVVGLEIKRELVAGELRDPRKALLPVVAAMGGMIVPALIYFALQWDEPGQRGWAIPMATDIAFVVGVLSLLGHRVPFGLKIALLSLAIVDDLGAVLVIAVVFTETIVWEWLAVAGGGFLIAVLLNLLGVRAIALYVFAGIIAWLGFLQAGIHPTVAGVLLGLLTPARAWIGDRTLSEVLEKTWKSLDVADPEERDRRADLKRVEFALRESESPLHRLETGLHPWMSFFIMPLFALANAGVAFDPSELSHPVSMAVAAGLVLGKPLGILLFTVAAVKAGVTRLPTGVDWKVMTGGACMAGIGFTMSLFLNGLSFPGPRYAEMAAAGKIGTLMGSLVSAVLGTTLLLIFLREKSAPPPAPAASGKGK